MQDKWPMIQMILQNNPHWVASMNRRRLGMKMVSIYPKMSQGVISMNRVNEQKSKLDQLMGRAKSTVKHPVNGGNIMDTDMPSSLCQDISLEVSYTWIDLLSAEITFKYLMMLSTKQPLRLELQFPNYRNREETSVTMSANQTAKMRDIACNYFITFS
jgi:hypothetical protein